MAPAERTLQNNTSAERRGPCQNSDQVSKSPLTGTLPFSNSTSSLRSRSTSSSGPITCSH